MVKLIGSQVEIEIREELTSGNQIFFSTSHKFKDFLEKLGHHTADAYILNWYTEPGSLFYTLLIEGTYILNMEFDKTDITDEGSSVIIDRQELEKYLHGLSKMHQIRLAVALDLVKQHQKSQGVE